MKKEIKIKTYLGIRRIIFDAKSLDIHALSVSWITQFRCYKLISGKNYL